MSGEYSRCRVVLASVNGPGVVLKNIAATSERLESGAHHCARLVRVVGNVSHIETP